MAELSNGDLRNDVEKHQAADEIDISTDNHFNQDDEMWVIDVNDSTYFYHNKDERDKDCDLLKDIFPDFIDMGMM